MDVFRQNSVLWGVISKWVVTAPADAVAWVEASPPGTNRETMVVNAVISMQEKNPQAALQVLRRNTTALNGFGNIASTLFSTWAGHDPQAAAAGALQLNGSLEQEALSGVAKAWAERDPRSALHWIDSLPKTLARQGLVQSVGDEWAGNDPRAELAWARGLKDETARRSATLSGISSLATADLGAALDVIQTLPAGDDHDQALQAAAEKAAESDARSALKILDQMPAGPMRNDLMRQFCANWGEAEPRAALDWLIQNAPAGKGGYQNVGDMVETWMQSAPDEAMAWAEALPAGDNRDTIMARIANGFVKTDLDRAQSFFAQLSPSAQSNAAREIANAIFQESPEKACAWAQSLPEGAAQKRAFERLGPAMGLR